MKKLILSILTATIASTSVTLSMQDDFHMYESITVSSRDNRVHLEASQAAPSQLKLLNDPKFPDDYVMPRDILWAMIHDIAGNIDPRDIRILYLPTKLNLFAFQGHYVSEYLRTINQAFPSLETLNIGIVTSKIQDTFSTYSKFNGLHFTIDRDPPKVQRKGRVH